MLPFFGLSSSSHHPRAWKRGLQVKPWIYSVQKSWNDGKIFPALKNPQFPTSFPSRTAWQGNQLASTRMHQTFRLFFIFTSLLPLYIYPFFKIYFAGDLETLMFAGWWHWPQAGREEMLLLSAGINAEKGRNICLGRNIDPALLHLGKRWGWAGTVRWRCGIWGRMQRGRG